MLKKNITRVIFALTIVSLFLPFILINAYIINVSFNGFQFIPGIGMRSFGFPGAVMASIDTQVFPPNIFIIISLLAAICGLAVSFLDKKKAVLLSGILGGIGVISLVIYIINIKTIMYGVVVDIGFGYYVDIILFALVIIVSILMFERKANDNLFENEYHTVDENLDLRPEVETSTTDEPSVDESPADSVLSFSDCDIKK
ncbi:MAG: hypothetical protein WC677_08150 [Clostridia bacterium]|jgi:hypothetical protein